MEEHQRGRHFRRVMRLEEAGVCWKSRRLIEIARVARVVVDVSSHHVLPTSDSFHFAVVVVEARSSRDGIFVSESPSQMTPFVYDCYTYNNDV